MTPHAVIRASFDVQGRRVGSIHLDGDKTHILIPDHATADELWEALARVVGAVQGGERSVE